MVNFSTINNGGSARVAQPEMAAPKMWDLDASELTHFQPNPIREIVDNIAKRPRNMDKSLISLSIGAPWRMSCLLDWRAVADECGLQAIQPCLVTSRRPRCLLTPLCAVHCPQTTMDTCPRWDQSLRVKQLHMLIVQRGSLSPKM